MNRYFLISYAEFYFRLGGAVVCTAAACGAARYLINSFHRR